MENKTRPSDANVEEYLSAIEDAARRRDCEALIRLMSKVTNESPRMWGASIVGFGSYHYKYESGREGDAGLTGFSSRKGDISVYLAAGAAEQGQLLARLGRHKMGKACLYLRRLGDVDLAVLEQLVAGSVAEVKRLYGGAGGSAVGQGATSAPPQRHRSGEARSASKSTRPITYAALKRRALLLPEVEESTSYGTPALKVRGKLMVRLKEDNQTVVLRTTWEERERLLATHPEVFFITEHYRSHALVLMSLPASTSSLAKHVLEFAWRTVAPRSLVGRL